MLKARLTQKKIWMSRYWVGLAVTGMSLVAHAQNSLEALQAERVFDWAEYAYPELFSSPATTSVLQGYLVRHYPGTGLYLGIKSGSIYGLGPAFASFENTGNGIRRVGAVTAFLPAIEADGFALRAGEKLLVTEAVAKDAGGGPDWFELFAAGTEPVVLSNYQVIDGNDDREPVRLPNITLAPGSYQIIYASTDALTTDQPRVAFGLSSNDRVQLIRNGKVVDDLDWSSGDAPEGYSFGRFPGPESSAKTLLPTPGTKNWAATVGTASALTQGLGSVGPMLSTVVHDISINVDPAEYVAVVDAYNRTGEKGWLEADISLDGITYQQAGIRLKGNSSLRGITTTSDPATVPWLVKLNKFVEGQKHGDLGEFVIRSNSSSTAMNEAVALDLLQLSGLASQDAVSVKLTINGSAVAQRLAIEHPDNRWMAKNFSATGALYKAESTGDYSYRGDDPAAYEDVFDQEAGKDNADLTPLIEFLKFINDSSDESFRAELPDRLDTDAFATYLAMQDLVDNFDDIDGPGNNSYLYYDTVNDRFTVVPWDYNLAFGQIIGGAGGMGIPGGAGGPGGNGFPEDIGGIALPGRLGGNGFPERIGDITLPGRPGGNGFPEGIGGIDVPGGIAGGGLPGGPVPGGAPGGMRANVLVQRFLANPEWEALYVARREQLQTQLYDSGVAANILSLWRDIVSSAGLASAAVIETEAQNISRYFE